MIVLLACGRKDRRMGKTSKPQQAINKKLPAPDGELAAFAVVWRHSYLFAEGVTEGFRRQHVLVGCHFQKSNQCLLVTFGKIHPEGRSRCGIP